MNAKDIRQALIDSNRELGVWIKENQGDPDDNIAFCEGRRIIRDSEDIDSYATTCATSLPTEREIDDWLKSQAPYNIEGKHIHKWLLGRAISQDKTEGCHNWADYAADFLKEQCTICSGVRLKGARLFNKIEYPDQSEWISVEDRLPDGHNELRQNEMEVLGYNEEWINLDFNPLGIRVCVYCEAYDNQWMSCKWDNTYDTFFVDEQSVPTHWKSHPKPPTK